MIRGSAIVFLCGLAFGQPAQNPTFEAAEVHVSSPNAYPFIRGGTLRGGRYEIHNATMVDLIRLAYNIDADKVGYKPPWLDADRGDKVIGGPGWLDADRFDIVATSPVSTPPDTVRLMLRALLVERFDLKVHDDMKPFPIYALTAGRMPRLKKAAEGEGFSGCRSDPPNLNPDAPDQTRLCRNVTMASLAVNLPGMATQYFENPVIDKTGLEGAWDFDLKWSDRSAPGSSGISIFDAVDKQLGLKLEKQSLPMAVIVVDQVNRKPKYNPPGMAQSFLGGPTEFEVADVKPSAPDSTMRGFRLQPGGRLNIQGMTLSNLIMIAWDIPPDMLIGAPKWLDSDRFDIVAKAPSEGVPSSQTMDIDVLRPMLQKLLVERFRIATHAEQQPIPVFALTAGRREPKLQKADAAVRSQCRFTPLPPGAPTGSPLTSGYTCRNTTMGQLAEQIRGWANAYINHAVVDLTGIEGGWDFTLRWTPQRSVPGAGRGGAPIDADPTGGLTVFEAVDRQLGLKLEEQKHAMPVLVIDHVEQKPAEN